MWCSEISIDASYSMESNIKRYLDEIPVHYEYQRISNRDVFSIAETDDSHKNHLINALSHLLLVDVKYHYIVSRIAKSVISPIEELLIAEMLFFDADYERDTLADILPLQYDYSIDGILNFTMQEMRDNWDYLVELFDRVAGDYEDIYVLLRFLHDSVSIVGAKIYLTEKNNNPFIFQVKSGECVNNLHIFDDKKKNILYTLVSTHTNELYVEHEFKFDIDRDVLSKILTVQFV